MTDAPRLRKAARLQGKTLGFRDATPADAAFIFSLRTDAAKSKHLTQVSGEIADQAAWLTRYARSTDQAYFIIESLAGEPLGAVRLYDPQGDSFCWGSWVLKADAPSSAAIESALMVYAYALDILGFTNAHFQVKQGNERVWQFHERFGAVRVAEPGDEYHYTLSNAAIRSSMQRYGRFLPGGAVRES